MTCLRQVKGLFFLAKPHKAQRTCRGLSTFLVKWKKPDLFASWRLCETKKLLIGLPKAGGK